jgi:membrane-associated phospholipid phosphatase
MKNRIHDRDRPWWFYEHEHAAGRALDVTVRTVPNEYPLKVRGFPSGHTCTTAAIAAAATVVFLRRKRRRAVVAGIWALTVLIGWSRMYLGSHWPLDVLGGAAIGVACGVFAAWWSRRAGWATNGG